MKKKALFSSLIGLAAIITPATLSLTSCSSDDEVLTMSESNYEFDGIKVVRIVDGKITPANSRSENGDGELALSFENEKSLDNFKKALEPLPADVRALKVKQFGVTPLLDIEDIAEAELDSIGEKATSESEFRILYAQFVDKYKGVLMQNNIDLEDLDLYLPQQIVEEEKVEYSLMNKDGIYVVGDDIRRIDNTKEEYQLPEDVAFSSMIATYDVIGGNTGIYVSPNVFGQTQQSAPQANAPNANGGKTYTNACDVKPKRHKRIIFYMGRKYDNVRLKMELKKKMWYGWKRDKHHDCILETHLSDNFKYITYQPLFIQKKGKIDTNFGNVTDNKALTGTVYLWTDMSIEHDANDKSYPDQYGLPARSYSKAIEVKINLKR